MAKLGMPGGQFVNDLSSDILNHLKLRQQLASLGASWPTAIDSVNAKFCPRARLGAQAKQIGCGEWQLQKM